MTQIKSRLAPKDCGDPAAVKTATGESLLLGSIIGTATGVKIGKMPDGVTEYKGLKGDFEAIPADPAKEAVRSGVLFLGDAFQSTILALLESEDGPDSVSFAFEIYSVKSKNAAGYSWAMKPLIEATEADPLSELRKLVTKAPEQAKIAAK